MTRFHFRIPRLLGAPHWNVAAWWWLAQLPTPSSFHPDLVLYPWGTSCGWSVNTPIWMSRLHPLSPKSCLLAGLYRSMHTPRRIDQEEARTGPGSSSGLYGLERWAQMHPLNPTDLFSHVSSMAWEGQELLLPGSKSYFQHGSPMMLSSLGFFLSFECLHYLSLRTKSSVWDKDI